MFDLTLKIFLLLTPILYTSFGFAARYQWYQFGYFSGSISLLQLQLFQYGIVALFLAALFDRPKRIFEDKLFAILFVVCAWNMFPHPITIKSFPTVFLGFLLYYLIVTYTKNVKSILKIVVVVSALNTIFAIFQSFGVYYPFNHDPNPLHDSFIMGLMSYKTNLGIYQAISLPICYVLNPYLAIIPAIGLALSKSGTAIIPAVIGMAYLCRHKLFKVKYINIYIVSFCSLVVLYCVKFFSKLNVRIDVWENTIALIHQKLFYGYGIGTFEYINARSIKYTDPYSLYLGVTHALGIFGIIALLIFIISKFVGFKYRTQISKGLIASCLILAICGLGYSFMDYSRLAGTSIALFGLLTVQKMEVSCEDQV